MKTLADGIQFPVELSAAPQNADVQRVAMRPKKIVGAMAPQKGMLAEMGFNPVADKKVTEEAQA